MIRKRWKILVRAFAPLFEHSTIHGCSELFQVRSIWKLLWLALMSMVLWFCGYQLYSLGVEYANDPMMTITAFEKEIEMPRMLISFPEETDCFNTSRMSHMQAKPHVLQQLLFKYLSISRVILKEMTNDDKDIVENLGYLTTGKVSAASMAKEIQTGRRDLAKELITYHGNITKLYEDYVNRREFKVRIWDCMKSNYNLTLTKRLSPVAGLSWEFQIHGINFTRNTMICLEFNCISKYFIIGMGTDIIQHDVSGKLALRCSYHYTLLVQPWIQTYHRRYCDASKDEADLSCEASCMVQQTRGRNECLPYFASPMARQNIPFCGFTDAKFNTKIRDRCFEQCLRCKSCHSCKRVSVLITVAWKEANSSASKALFAIKSQVDSFHHHHTEPKYTVANLVGGIGGIIGIGFGISLMSIFQAALYCGKAFKTLVREQPSSGEKITDPPDPTTVANNNNFGWAAEGKMIQPVIVSRV